MNYDKYKDAPPQETVHRIRKCLRELDLEVQEIVDERLSGVYSASLSDLAGRWSTAGKGTTRDYCLASAYGEMMEHLSNYYAYDTTLLTDASLRHKGFQRYPDEILLPIQSIPEIAPDVFRDMQCSNEMNTSVHADTKDVCGLWEALLQTDKTVFIPYYSVKQQKEVLLPDLVLYDLCGSNGGGAGNTPYEALGHAFDEIMERYVKYHIYFDRMTPPDVPMEYILKHCAELYTVIREISERSGYDLYVKDASMGCGRSVVSVLLIDRVNRRYLANFGAHPLFHIALERCLTEMFQSFTLHADQHKRKRMIPWSTEADRTFACTKNWVSLLRDDCGELPNHFLAGDPSWAFHPWPVLQDYTNQSGMQFQLKKLLEIGSDVYIRDASYLGFPTFRVYVPGVSVSHLPFDSFQVDCIKRCSQLDCIVRGYNTMSETERRELCEYLFSEQSYWCSLMFKNLGEDEADHLHAGILWDIKEYEAAYKLLQKQPGDSIACTISDMDLAREGYSASARDKLLKVFFAPSDILFAGLWRERDVFPALLNHYAAKGKINLDATAKSTRVNAINTLHCRVKDRMALQRIDQMRLNKILR